MTAGIDPDDADCVHCSHWWEHGEPCCCGFPARAANQPPDARGAGEAELVVDDVLLCDHYAEAVQLVAQIRAQVLSDATRWRETLEMLAADAMWDSADPDAIPVRVRDIARAALARADGQQRESESAS